MTGPESFGPSTAVCSELRSLLSLPREVSAHPVDVGQRSEAIILAELVKRGNSGSPPVRDQPPIRPRLEIEKQFVRAYDGEADLFLVYCPDTERVYAVSVDEAASSEAKLRVAPTANGQAKGVRWAADHELPA